MIRWLYSILLWLALVIVCVPVASAAKKKAKHKTSASSKKGKGKGKSRKPGIRNPADYGFHAKPEHYSKTLDLRAILKISDQPDFEAVAVYLGHYGWAFKDSTPYGEDNVQKFTYAPIPGEAKGTEPGDTLRVYYYEDEPGKVEISFHSKAYYTAMTTELGSTGFGRKQYGGEPMKRSKKGKGKKKKGSTAKAPREKTLPAGTYANQRFLLRLIKDNGDPGQLQYNLTLIKRLGPFDPNITHDDSVNMRKGSIVSLDGGGLNGTCVTYHPNGAIKTVSNMQHGRKVGVSNDYDERGNLISQFNYSNDIANGSFRVYYPFGQLAKYGIMRSGRIEGMLKEYRPNGLLSATYNYHEGVRDGEASIYDTTVDVEYITQKGMYVNGKQSGRWDYYKLEDGKTNYFKYVYFENDMPNGAFFIVQRDNMMLGHYKNDSLDGPCYLYVNPDHMVSDLSQVDTSAEMLLAAYTYSHGKKDGPITYYQQGKIWQTGYYTNDLMSGTWTYFNPVSGDTLNCRHYKDGQLNGSSIAYFRDSSFRYNFDTTSFSGFHFPRISKTGARLREEAIYQENLLNGLYVLRNEQDEIVSGSFTNGKPGGNITMMQTDAAGGYLGSVSLKFIDGLPSGPFYSKDMSGKLMEKGHLEKGLRNGLWEQYYNNGRLKSSEYYNNGVHDSLSEYYFSNGVAEATYLYRKGKLVSLAIYNTTEDLPGRQYDIMGINGTEMRFSQRLQYHDSTVIEEFVVTIAEPYNDIAATLRAFDATEVLKETNAIKGRYRYNGQHRVERAGESLVSGTYMNSKRNGEWTFRYPEQKISLTIKYKEGQPVHEYFYNEKKGVPYTGIFRLPAGNNKTGARIRVKNGARNGKSKYFNEAGHVIKKEKYKAGTRLK